MSADSKWENVKAAYVWFDTLSPTLSCTGGCFHHKTNLCPVISGHRACSPVCRCLLPAFRTPRKSGQSGWAPTLEASCGGGVAPQGSVCARCHVCAGPHRLEQLVCACVV